MDSPIKVPQVSVAGNSASPYKSDIPVTPTASGENVDRSSGIKAGHQNVGGLFFPMAGREILLLGKANGREISLVERTNGWTFSVGPDPRQPKFSAESVDVFKVLDLKNSQAIAKKEVRHGRFARFLLWIVDFLASKSTAVQDKEPASSIVKVVNPPSVIRRLGADIPEVPSSMPEGPMPKFRKL